MYLTSVALCLLLYLIIVQLYIFNYFFLYFNLGIISTYIILNLLEPIITLHFGEDPDYDANYYPDP